jgi:hypothetical protein
MAVSRLADKELEDLTNQQREEAMEAEAAAQAKQ